jgi:hypothetical protein
MIAAVYGLQALVFVLRRKWDMVGWMFFYILAIPVFSFFLPLYSFWRMDDFSWGQTRIVLGESGKKMVVHVRCFCCNFYLVCSSLYDRMRVNLIPVQSRSSPGMIMYVFLRIAFLSQSHSQYFNYYRRTSFGIRNRTTALVPGFRRLRCTTKVTLNRTLLLSMAERHTTNLLSLVDTLHHLHKRA